jgi:hypothetical protein
MGEMRPNKAPIEMRTEAAAISAPTKFSRDNLIQNKQELKIFKLALS